MTPARPRAVLESLTATYPTGETALIIGPSIPDSATDHEKERLVRRRIVASGGTCPCGARLRLPNRAARRKAARAGRAIHVDVHHADDCPAIATPSTRPPRCAR